MSKTLLEMKNISKEFPGVLALDKVNFNIEKGEIHALVGENGAGKSTLMNILSGVYSNGNYTGEIIFEGQKYEVKGIKQSEDRGISIIHQEFTLIPYLTIAENIYMGNEIQKHCLVNLELTQKKASELIKVVGLEEDVNTLIKDIGVGKQQLVEIAKALSKKVKLLILDEPTSALNIDDSKNLLDLLVKFKDEGITSILISHKLQEVARVADKITILRDGKTIETIVVKNKTISEDRIIKGMVGRDLSDMFPKRKNKIGDVFFEVKDWTAYHPLNTERRVSENINLYVRSGEVIGIAGLMGAGRTELAMGIFGKSYGTNITGEVYKRGKKIDVNTVGKAIKNGIAYISEDRKGLGLIVNNSVKNNITLSNLKRISKNNVINENEEIISANEAVEAFKIKCTSIVQEVRSLSGGNQQKVVLAKWLFCDSDLYIMDEPTRGIDVGAKHDIYELINDLAMAGKAIIFISSELQEVLGVCDRLYVMNSGKLVGELDKNNASQEKIMKLLV